MHQRNQTAFVLSGGGSLGAAQVGMLLALAESEVVPDLIIGTSVGAVNAVWVAGRPGPGGAAELAAIWRSVRRDDIFPLHPLGGLLGFAGRRDHLVDPSRFRRLLARHLQQRLAADAAQVWEGVELRIVPPLCPLAVSPMDFSQTARLIDGAYESTARWLDAGAPAGAPARLLGPHHH